MFYNKNPKISSFNKEKDQNEDLLRHALTLKKVHENNQYNKNKDEYHRKGLAKIIIIITLTWKTT